MNRNCLEVMNPLFSLSIDWNVSHSEIFFELMIFEIWLRISFSRFCTVLSRSYLLRGKQLLLKKKERTVRIDWPRTSKSPETRNNWASRPCCYPWRKTPPPHPILLGRSPIAKRLRAIQRAPAVPHSLCPAVSSSSHFSPKKSPLICSKGNLLLSSCLIAGYPVLTGFSHTTTHSIKNIKK